MLKKISFFLLISILLGACASKMRDQMKEYRELFARGEYAKAAETLEKSELKGNTKALLLWNLEKGTLAFRLEKFDEAIAHFEEASHLIDELFTKRLSAKAASLLVNDASDVFYGASYERSYTYYFLSKSYYARYLKSGNKLDLQGARAAILAWDTYFTDLQRSSTVKTLYQTDLMMKVFGGEVHEVSEIRNDKQIALQLYKDAAKILEQQGGLFSVFNTRSTDYTKAWAESVKAAKSPAGELYQKTHAYDDLKDFIHYKILSLTKEIRGGDYQNQLKILKPSKEVLEKLKGEKGNVVLVLEEGLIPPKIGKPFNFGLRSAIESSKSSSTRKLIADVGVGFVTAFAMNQLGLAPTHKTSPGTFIFGEAVTRVAVTEAAVEFELPMIENVPLVQRMELFILDDKGVIVHRGPLPIVTENGDIARVVLEEDVVSRYVKTGTRVALKHLAAIITAIGVYKKLSSGRTNGDFLAKTAAVATYVGAAKGLASLERADTRHWTTLPQALRLTELHLKPGKYKVALGLYSDTKAPEAPSKLLSDFEVNESGKSIHTLAFSL